MRFKTVIIIILCCVISTTKARGEASPALSLGGSYTAEWQWGLNGNTSLVNLLRFELEYRPWENGSFELATHHIARTNEPVVDDLQLFSNIYEENNFAAIATIGYRQSWNGNSNGDWSGSVFVGARNLNEDFFTSHTTSLFTSSSPGIFPTISGSYPIANYPTASLNITFDIAWREFKLMNALYNGVGYCGWTKDDNPLIFKPKEDGLFNVTELAHETESHYYSLGCAYHTKYNPTFWAYAEQSVSERLRLMAQYSQNKGEECNLYAELGAMYSAGESEIGLSAQYAKFSEANELSIEATYLYQVNSAIALQPSVFYIRTGTENSTVITARFIYEF